jgi:glycosyltransferase involved in cell wall biosynthesis
MTVGAAKQPDVSVIIATYNRCEVLRGALESLMRQDAPWTNYEVVVVDNNSTDETRRTVEDLRDTRGNDNLIYCFEGKQGVSHARNRGIAMARAPMLAFTDDDIRPARDWVSAISAGFKRFPQVDCIGGKVLPDAGTKFPGWLTTEHWTPLALLDLGDQPLELDVRNGPGLVGANLVLRAAVFKEIGMFPTELQRVKDSIGSLEDHEFQLRLSAAGKRLMYLPELVVHAHVLEERLDKSYHRRWYCGHGHFYAVMRDEQFESSKMRLFDVPAHLYRRTLTHGLDWLKYRLARRGDLEFQQELELHFFWGFLRKRLADRRSIPQVSNSRTNK